MSTSVVITKTPIGSPSSGAAWPKFRSIRPSLVCCCKQKRNIRSKTYSSSPQACQFKTPANAPQKWPRKQTTCKNASSIKNQTSSRYSIYGLPTTTRWSAYPKANCVNSASNTSSPINVCASGATYITSLSGCLKTLRSCLIAKSNSATSNH